MLKRLLRYINRKKENRITYCEGKGTLLFKGYMKADWRGLENRKSTTSNIFTLNGTPISWMSKKQQTITLFSTKVEYIVLTTATKEAM